MMTPEVSVVIASYNNAPYLSEAIDSILAQSGIAGVEVIVVDDASADDTARVLDAYRDRIVSRRLPANTGGPAAPRNAGLRLARGEFVAILDADDVMLPGKLEAQCALLRRHPDIPFVFTNFRNFTAEGPAAQPFLADHPRFHATDRQPLGADSYRLPAERVFETLLIDNFVGTSGVLMRRALVEEIGEFDEELHCGEDLDYWIRISRRYDMAYIDREYHRRRLHLSNISARTSSLEDVIKMAERLHREELPAGARRNLRTWLSALHFTVGYRYKLGGQRGRAIRHYLASLTYRKANMRAWLALLKALVPMPGRAGR